MPHQILENEYPINGKLPLKGGKISLRIVGKWLSKAWGNVSQYSGKMSPLSEQKVKKKIKIKKMWKILLFE